MTKSFSKNFSVIGKSTLSIVFFLSTFSPLHANASFEDTEKALKACEVSTTRVLGSDCNDENSAAIKTGEATIDPAPSSKAMTTTGNEAEGKAGMAAAALTAANAICEGSMMDCGMVCKKVQKYSEQDKTKCIAEAGQNAEKKTECESKAKEFVAKAEKNHGSCKTKRMLFGAAALGLLGSLGMLAKSAMDQKAGTEKQQDQNQQAQNSSSTTPTAAATAAAACKPNDLACLCKDTATATDSRCSCYNKTTGYVDEACSGTRKGGVVVENTKSIGGGGGTVTPSAATNKKYTDLKNAQAEGTLGTSATTSSNVPVTVNPKTAGRALGLSGGNGSSSEVAQGAGSGSGTGAGGTSDVGDSSGAGGSAGSSDTAGSGRGGKYTSELAQYLPSRSGTPSRAQASLDEEADRAQVAPRTSNIWANLSRAYRNAKLIEH